MTMLVYYDRAVPETEARHLLGLTRYGDLFQTRDRLWTHVERMARQAGMEEFRHVTSGDDLARLKVELEARPSMRVVHLGSGLAPTNVERFTDVLRRLRISTEACRATWQGAPAPLLACGPADYLGFLRTIEQPSLAEEAAPDARSVLSIELDGAVTSLDDPAAFLDFLSGSLNSRHFNAMRREKREVVKASSKVDKIRSEHDFYHLLPARLQRWFVMPYDLAVDGASASYRMERLLVPDMGKQWIHGGLTVSDFSAFLEDVGLFLRERPTRECGTAVARAHFDALYRGKLLERLEQLRQQPLFGRLDAFVRNGTSYAGIDAIVESYIRALDRLGTSRRPVEAIGHGDLCFSNMLYDKRIRFLKLIDPKGALSADALYTDPYYDLAKLSHSVLGGYDFIVNGLYELHVDEEVELSLVLLSHDLNPYRVRFVGWLEEQGWDPVRVRLYEASLFLSMLPYHVDRPRNLLAFLLTAANILSEVERQQ
jgi:hypothetical protein